MAGSMVDCRYYRLMGYLTFGHQYSLNYSTLARPCCAKLEGRMNLKTGLNGLLPSEDENWWHMSDGLR